MNGRTVMEIHLARGQHRQCPVCQEMIEQAHAEALVEAVLMRIGPDDTIPTVEAIAAAEAATDFALVG